MGSTDPMNASTNQTKHTFLFFPRSLHIILEYL